MSPDPDGLTPVHLQSQAGPDFGEVRGPGASAQQHRPGTVIGAGDEYIVPDHQGGHGIDGIIGSSAEPTAEEYLAVVGVEHRETLSGEGVNDTSPVNF